MDALQKISIQQAQNEIENLRETGTKFFLVFVNKSKKKGTITKREFKKSRKFQKVGGKKSERKPRKKSNINLKENRLWLLYDVKARRPRHISIDYVFFAKFGEDWYEINHG